jgi:hypothetical protein
MMLEFPTQAARPVWIASYPRSGNTFLRIILRDAFRLPSYSLYYVEGDTHHDPSAEALEQAPQLPRNWQDSVVRDPAAAPILIKTHDPPSDQSPAIFIARDGRAAIHSYYHYHKKYAFEQPSLTEIIAGACQFGSWSEHYRAWLPKSRPNTLLILYEDLVANPQVVIQALAGFLNLTPADACLPEFHELQRKLPSFFRRGQNSDYLSEWTPAHMALFNQLHAAAMQELGFPVCTVTESSERVVGELAGSAARLHKLYLEQLTRLGRADINHQEHIRHLSSQIRQLSRQLEQKLKPNLKTRWLRVGLEFGAPRSTGNEKAEPFASESVPIGQSNGRR